MDISLFNTAFKHVLLAWLLALSGAGASAQTTPEPSFTMTDTVLTQVRDFLHANRPPGEHRIAISVGTLDARLKLAPCQKVQTYLPFGSKPWGKTRVGLRCLDGTKRWNVTVPATVQVFGPAWVVASALPLGHVLTQQDLQRADIDLSAEPSPALSLEGEAPIGRSLARPLLAGAGLRESHLKRRQWFAAGEAVRIRAVGNGFAIAGAGEAITSGIEGQTARVRTDAGRVVTGKPVGEHLIEIAL